MKMMFCVLGEGRGHMTQAMAVKEMAEIGGARTRRRHAGRERTPAGAGILRVGHEDARPAVADLGVQI